MNAKLLIDAITRQTMVLIGQLATTAGLRAPLAHVANQVFLDLVDTIESQGVSRKVAADMFGLALRSYQLKVQRLSESATDRRRSLWEAVFAFICEEGVVGREKVLMRFCHDDERSVRGILHDLVESGLVFKTGSRDRTSYRAASDEELSQLVDREERDSMTGVAFVAVYHHGPITVPDLAARLQIEEGAARDAIERLRSEGRITRHEAEGEDAEPTYDCDVCVIPMDSPVGWEAALFDHFKAMVTAIQVKLRESRRATLPGDVVGGSTYRFELWEDHPRQEEVLGLLAEIRERVSSLREEVTSYRDESPPPDGETYKVTFYCGQAVVRPDEDLEVLETVEEDA
jgi:hypothetical protein